MIKSQKIPMNSHQLRIHLHRFEAQNPSLLAPLPQSSPPGEVRLQLAGHRGTAEGGDPVLRLEAQHLRPSGAGGERREDQVVQLVAVGPSIPGG